MYNRYIPGSNGIYERHEVPSPTQKQHPMPSPVQSEVNCESETKQAQIGYRPQQTQQFDPGDLLLLCIILLILLDADEEDPLLLIIAAAAFILFP